MNGRVGTGSADPSNSAAERLRRLGVDPGVSADDLEDRIAEERDAVLALEGELAALRAELSVLEGELAALRRSLYNELVKNQALAITCGARYVSNSMIRSKHGKKPRPIDDFIIYFRDKYINLTNI